jgi:hypothetical protein
MDPLTRREQKERTVRLWDETVTKAGKVASERRGRKESRPPPPGKNRTAFSTIARASIPSTFVFRIVLRRAAKRRYDMLYAFAATAGKTLKQQ